MPAGRPSSKNHTVGYDNTKRVAQRIPDSGGVVPVDNAASGLFEDKRIYEGAAPTYVTSVMQQPSTEFFANNRRKVVSPPGNGLRPNTSIEFGRTTGNILLADSLAGRIPSETPGGHLYGRSGHAVARDGRRQMKLPEDVTHKETGHRLKDLLYNSGASIDAGETDLNFGVSKRVKVSLHGDDAAGKRHQTQGHCDDVLPLVKIFMAAKALPRISRHGLGAKVTVMADHPAREKSELVGKMSASFTISELRLSITTLITCTKSHHNGSNSPRAATVHQRR